MEPRHPPNEKYAIGTGIRTLIPTIRLHPTLEFASQAAVPREERHAVGVGVGVDQLQRVVVSRRGLRRAARVRGLVAVDRHVWSHVVEEHGPRK